MSPDGQMLAFSDRGPNGGLNQIWIRPMSAPAAYPLAGTEGVTGLFWSPDSQTISGHAHN